MKIALLTCQKYPDLHKKEQVLATQISKDIEVKVEIWNDPSVNWASYDCLIFRTVWDYFEYPNEFATWLKMLRELNIKTLNPLAIIQYNQHKFYLKDLEEQGIDIIPTVFISKNTKLDLSFIKERNWQKAVIKPAISGGSYLTKLFSDSEITVIEKEYTTIAFEIDLLVQPFIPEVQENGELSLLFFQGKYSHAIVKKPKKGDFRVQYQFGGTYEIYEPSKALIKTSENILKKFKANLLYARVDGILQNGKFLLMEVELLEPDLYFDYVPEAQKRYVKAMENMLRDLFDKTLN